MSAVELVIEEKKDDSVDRQKVINPQNPYPNLTKTDFCCLGVPFFVARFRLLRPPFQNLRIQQG